MKKTLGQPYLKIGEVARLIGVSPSVIRTWEGLGLTRPQRTASKYRLYSEDDVKLLKRARFLRRVRGMNAPAIVQMLKKDGLVRPRPQRAAGTIGPHLRRLRTEAPHCRVELHPLGPDFDAERVLAEDRLDVIIGNWPEPPERLHLSLLLEDELVCLVRRGHPLAAAPLTDERYLAAAHVVPLRYSSQQRGVVETHLATLRAQRDARVSVPYFAFAPHVVAETDLVFTTARHFAEPYTRTLPVVMLEAPPGFPSMRFYQLWHERAHHASAHRWLRGVIAEVGRALAPRRTKAASG